MAAGTIPVLSDGDPPLPGYENLTAHRPGSMFQGLKRLTTHSAIYGLSDVLGRSMAYLLVPVYTHVMPVEEFGYYGLVYTFIALTNVVFLYGMDSAFLRYYVLEEDRKRDTLSTGYLTMLFTSAGLAVIIVLFAARIAPLIAVSASLTSYVQLAAAVLALDALNAIPFARLRGEGKAATFASLKLMKVMIELGGNCYLVVVLDMGLQGILISNIAGSGIVFVILAGITLRHLSFSWSRGTMGRLLRFGLPYVPAGACIIIIETIDRLMLERMAGTETLGIYHAARKLGVGMLIFVTMFRQAWQPFFLETSREENPRPLFARVLTYFLALAGGIFLALSYLIDDLVRISIGGYTLIEASYWEGIAVVPILLAAYVLYGIYVNLTVGVYLEKKTILLPFITAASALVCILTNLWLIPEFGMYGAATASAAAYAVMVAGLYLVGRRYYPIPYEYIRLLKVVLAVGVLFAVRELTESAWPGQIAWPGEIALVAAYPVALWAMRFFNAGEMAFARRYLRLRGS